MIRMRKTVFLLTMMVYSCTFISHRNGKLVYTRAKPEAGFNYPYFLFIPTETSQEKGIYLVVETNNSGFTSDQLKEHVEKAKRTATRNFYIGNYVSVHLKYPLLVPVFPRPDSCWKIYTHALDRDVALERGNDFERLDLQLLAMTADATGKLKDMGYSIHEKFLLTGFSASGTFANRFTLIHPEKILAVAAGGLNGMLMLPLDSMAGKPLNYPIGVNDFSDLFGKPFNLTSFRQVPQFLFMGQLDNNDAVPYEDAYDPAEQELIFELLGREMLPARWNACVEIYRRHAVNSRCVIYKGIGHEHPDAVKEDILVFFKSMINEGLYARIK
jgi:hypothetical protein